MTIALDNEENENDKLSALPLQDSAASHGKPGPFTCVMRPSPKRKAALPGGKTA